MLNSFLGKFGQQFNLPRTKYLTEPVKYFDLLTSEQQNVLNDSFVHDEMVRIQWVNNDNFIENTGRANVIIAAYTTAQALFKLYSYLEKLDRWVRYADTGSIVLTTKSGEWKPEIGNYFWGLNKRKSWQRNRCVCDRKNLKIMHAFSVKYEESPRVTPIYRKNFLKIYKKWFKTLTKKMALSLKSLIDTKLQVTLKQWISSPKSKKRL